MSLIAAGQIVTADALNELAPLNVIKPSDQSYVNTTLQNDTDLVISVAANSQYLFNCFLDYEGGTLGSADMKWTFTMPAGATLVYSAIYISTGGSAQVAVVRLGATTYTAGTNGAGVLVSNTMQGSLITGAAAGPLQFQTAQNSASATAMKIHAQSFLALTQVG